MTAEKGLEVSSFLLNEVTEHPSDLALIVSKKFGFTRQRASEYIRREVEKGTIIKIGKTRRTRYFLATGDHIEFEIEVKPGLDEDRVWTEYVKPLVSRFQENIRDMCNFGFTEIFNNAIDHSGGSEIYAYITIDKNYLIITIMDNGIGIFRKIKNALNLNTVREAVFHLSKGKFTTDPSNHTGEGIFWTSRAFDEFSISSEEMFYTFTGRDWLFSPEKMEPFGKGTQIEMRIDTNSKKTLKNIFRQFEDSEHGFTKTIVAVALSADENDPHISRSQAKRLMTGLEKFKNIILDFKNVPSVGQAFVDQVFRVFREHNPSIEIKFTNANSDVEEMIKRGVPDFDKLKL